LAICARIVEGAGRSRRLTTSFRPRGIERAGQFVPGAQVDRWLFAILRSVWLNEIRSRHVREGGGFVDAEDVLTTDGAREIEMNITASAVLRAIDRLPEAQRETILLVKGEGYSYAEAAATLGVPIGTIMSRLAAGRAGAGETEIGGLGKPINVRR
jgi:RNA polymerase sigma-70 factor (ECF subfamily)